MGDMAISGSIFGRGEALSRRRCPETPPKVRAIHEATSGSPNSELIKALKKVCPPPPPLNHIIWFKPTHSLLDPSWLWFSFCPKFAKAFSEML